MTQLEASLLYATLAGAMIPLGGLLALWERLRPDWLEREFRHSVIAFGGGVLLAAVAFVLAPEGAKALSPAWAVGALLLGGTVFLLLDRWIERRGDRASQLIAMVSDFVPEAMALGAVFASASGAGPLLAILIGLQNFPEGFNAYREILSGGRRNRWIILLVFVALVPLGPLAALLGHVHLSERPALLGAVMLFAAGGILYLIFQDIAPQARLKRAWGPPLGAVLGFAFGLLGHMLLG